MQPFLHNPTQLALNAFVMRFFADPHADNKLLINNLKSF